MLQDLDLVCRYWRDIRCSWSLFQTNQANRRRAPQEETRTARLPGWSCFDPVQSSCSRFGETSAQISWRWYHHGLVPVQCAGKNLATFLNLVWLWLRMIEISHFRSSTISSLRDRSPCPLQNIQFLRHGRVDTASMACSLLCIERVGCSQRSCVGHHFPPAFVLPGVSSRARWYPSDR